MQLIVFHYSAKASLLDVLPATPPRMDAGRSVVGSHRKEASGLVRPAASEIQGFRGWARIRSGVMPGSEGIGSTGRIAQKSWSFMTTPAIWVEVLLSDRMSCWSFCCEVLPLRLIASVAPQREAMTRASAPISLAGVSMMT